MPSHFLVKVCAWSLGITLFWAIPACATPLTPGSEVSQATVSSAKKRQLSEPLQVLQELATADVVYLGETHDRPEDHQAQLAIIQALHQLQPRMAIAMEMFQQPYQSALNRYLAGEIDEAELQRQSQYSQRWGFPWEYYAPILRFAREKKIPVIALNTPSEITRKVARQGLGSLTAEEQQQIPPVAELRTDDTQYRQYLLNLYQDMHQGKGSSASFDRFFLAQVLWDETMAARVADFLTAHDHRPVVVLAGQGHLIYGYGIPNRVARRMQRVKKFRQRLILLNPDETDMAHTEPAIADYFWQTAKPD